MSPKFEWITVRLTGADGNAFSILGLVTKAMRRAGVGKEDRDAYMREATSGDYDHLLQTTHRYVSVE